MSLYRKNPSEIALDVIRSGSSHRGLIVKTSSIVPRNQPIDVAVQARFRIEDRSRAGSVGDLEAEVYSKSSRPA